MEERKAERNIERGSDCIQNDVEEGLEMCIGREDGEERKIVAYQERSELFYTGEWSEEKSLFGFSRREQRREKYLWLFSARERVFSCSEE